jgi:hypothetical protein
LEVPPDRPRQLWLLPVLLITVIATAVGGLLARTVYEDPGPPVPDPVVPSSTSLPPGDQPGSKVVEGTPDATQHPLYQALHELVQRHFDAINAHDYAAWQGTVTGKRMELLPQDKWEGDYQSTKDGSIVILRIEQGDEDTARVLMTFTSVQNPANAPPELKVGCIRWNVVYALVIEGDGWKLDASPASVAPQHERCP